jgi:HSP20 family protein
MGVFNDVIDTINAITTTANTSSKVPSNSYGYDYIYYPLKDNFWRVVEEFTVPTISIPPYPVSNYAVDENLASIIQMAVTGFSEDEISIRREDLKLIVEGKKSEEREEDKKKYFYRNIAERNFKVSYQGSEKWNFDKLEAKIKNGILTITIPMREECKPVKQTYEINK